MRNQQMCPETYRSSIAGVETTDQGLRYRADRSGRGKGIDDHQMAAQIHRAARPCGIGDLVIRQVFAASTPVTRPACRMPDYYGTIYAMMAVPVE
jgi:hypothetical protein